VFKNKLYKEIGISDKEIFTDEEFNALPSLSVLYKVWKEYEALCLQKETLQTSLTVAEERNSALPDNSEVITELDSLIRATEAAYTLAGILDKITLTEAKEKYIIEKARWESEQTPTDTRIMQSDIYSLTGQITAKVIEVNEECLALEIGDLL